MVLPTFEHGSPSRYYARPGVVATSFRRGGSTVLLVELSGEQLGLTKKYASGQTWLSGGEHVVRWASPDGSGEATTRLAGNVLLWEAHGVTYRLEGDLSRADALELAGQISP